MEHTASDRRTIGPLADTLLLAAIVFGLALFSIALTRSPGTPALVWLGNGVLVGWLLTRPTSRWPMTLAAGLAGELCARALVGQGWLFEASLAAANLIEVLIVARVVRRRIPDLNDPRSWPKVGAVSTGATLYACAVSGMLVSALPWAKGDNAWIHVLLVWYSVHVVGMVLMATLVTVIRQGGLAEVSLPRRRLDFLGTMLLLGVMSLGVFSQHSYPLLFLTYPPLLLAAFRHRFLGVVCGVALLGAIGISATLLHSGPLAMSSLHQYGNVEQVVLLQLFIGAACILTFPVALAVAERSRLMRRMRESEARYRMLADHSSDLVMRLDGDGRRIYVSPSAREIVGYDPDSLLHASVELVHPEDRDTRARMLAELAATGTPAMATYRVKHAHGHYVWLEAIARPLPGADAGVIMTSRDVTARVVAEQELAESRAALEALVRIDSLTGVANRRQLDERLALAIIRARRHHQPLALMYLDIDYFKRVNDTLGHAAGDAVLRGFAQRLTSSVRASDLVARIGGDEFVILVEDAGLPGSAEVIARKLIAAMATPIDVDGAPVAATTSIGIAFSTNGPDAEALMAGADAALYSAKDAGRNTYRMITVDTPAA